MARLIFVQDAFPYNAKPLLRHLDAVIKTLTSDELHKAADTMQP